MTLKAYLNVVTLKDNLNVVTLKDNLNVVTLKAYLNVVTLKAYLNPCQAGRTVLSELLAYGSDFVRAGTQERIQHP